MLIRNAEIAGRRTELRCRRGSIVEIAPRLDPRAGEDEFDARGGALLSGLHDHHLHLLALAASLDSIACGPPAIASRGDLARALERARPRDGWLRGTGYFESVAGPLDRHRLDALHAEHAVRIQHRSGSMWFLNSRAIARLGLDSNPASPGIERDRAGRATGRLFRLDGWLRERLPSQPAPDLSRVGELLARHGVTRVTDATPSNGSTELALFRAAQADGALPQRLRLMGGLSLSTSDASTSVASTSDASPDLEIAEYKILLDEPSLPDLEELSTEISAAHEAGRPVAIHTVTRTEIHFALAALEAAGTLTGDRLEHASVTPPEALDDVRRLRIGIVTQPNFIAERGDAYRKDVTDRDRPFLYRVASWLDAGVPLAAGTDAPFGRADPWLAIRAAITRQTPSSGALGIEERVEAETAIGLFSDGFVMTPANRAPGLRLRIGQPADLCLLDAPWKDAREDLSSERVAATLCGGKLIWSRGA